MRTRLTCITILAVLAAPPMVLAWGGGPGPAHGPGDHPISDREGAIASLDALGSETGWGHVSVRDRIMDEGVDREVSVCVFGLEPDSTYTFDIDGLVLGEMVTDVSGAATLRLQSPERMFPPVPDALPAAEALELATVTDDSGAATLEGTFVGMPDRPTGGSQLVWMERIRLDQQNGSEARGVASVTRDITDVQTFASQASRLEVGASYTVTVDGIVAAIVVADAVGHGSLTLSTGDPDWPLPTGLQPIEDLRLVEWRRADGDVILSGSFAGEDMTGNHWHDGAGGDNGDAHGGDDGHGQGGHGGGDGGTGGGSGDGGSNGGGGDCDGSHQGGSQP